MIDTPVLERVLGEALRHGGEFAEVFAEDRSTSSALLDDGRVEELSSGRERGAGIRVVSGDTTGFAHTADLSEAGLLPRRRGGLGRGPARRGRDRHGGRRPAAHRRPAGRRRGRRGRRLGVPLVGLQRREPRPAGPGRRGGPGVERRHRPGPGRVRGIQAPGPHRQLRRPLRPRRAGPQPVLRVVCGLGRHRPPDRLRDGGPHPGLRAVRRGVGRGAGRPGRPPRPVQAVGPSGPLGRAARGAGRGERWHPVPRGLRPRPRGRPHREGRLGLHRDGGPAGGQPPGDAGRRRHRRFRVGDVSAWTTRAARPSATSSSTRAS